MKTLFRIVICVILSFILQFAVLFYLDKILLKESTQFTIENIEVPEQNISTNVDIPANAKEIQVSYNGRYITYCIDNKVILVDINASECKEILDNTEILSAKWIPNNNTIFVVERNSDKVNVKTYNATNGVEHEICELCDYENNINVDTYISVSSEYIVINNTTIYRVNIEKEIQELDKPIETLGSACVFENKDVFLYGDSENKNFYRYTNRSSKKIDFHNKGNLVILKAVGDMIYIGEYSDNNKISKIIYGEDESDTSTWITKTLEKTQNIEDIYISSNNEIFINDDFESTVNNITTGETIPYKGTFISINDKVLCSLYNGKLYLNILQ